MSSDAQKQSLLNAVSLIRAAEQLLVQASRDSTDANKSIQINTEYQHLDSLLSQMLQAQAISDDDDFAAATTALKSQSSALQADRDKIESIVTDVSLAAQIVGYLAQAASFLAGL